MVAALLLAALLAPLATPAAPPPQVSPLSVPCSVPPVPVFPGARQIGGLLGPEPTAWVSSAGRSTWATDEPLLSIQQFYFIRLTRVGWAPVAQLPGQHPGSFAGPDRGPLTVPEPILEFSLDGARVRIIGEAGGYTLWLEC